MKLCAPTPGGGTAGGKGGVKREERGFATGSEQPRGKKWMGPGPGP